MRVGGTIAWSEKVDEFVVEIERLFGMMLDNADKRRLLFDAVHRSVIGIWRVRFLGSCDTN